MMALYFRTFSPSKAKCHQVYIFLRGQDTEETVIQERINVASYIVGYKVP